jgi:phosphatidylglycerol---prolipoprotein diacylglyceryl transferase
MIPDTHLHPAHWGLRPIAFHAGGHPVTTYALFVTLGLVAAVVLYYFNVRKHEVGHDGLYIALAAAVGGILGAKLPIWVANAGAIVSGRDLSSLLSGRTIVGGIIGGAIAVYLTKKRLGITRRLGNYLVPSLCLGIAVGRIGCLLTGCCYGVATRLPWGVDFGDGIARHPTQLYEALFMLGFFAFAQITKDRFAPGDLFKAFMVVYFAWRFLVEFIRVNPSAAFGLTYYQIVALAVVAYYSFRIGANAVARRRE